MAPQAQRKRPQFFQVLSSDAFTNQMIPHKFHEHLPHKHRKTATLVSPNGKFWHVKITRIGRDIYFQKGWLEFAKSHGLEEGYMLVFRYEGNMIFNVKIFDTTGCLKDYSLTYCAMPIWAPSPSHVYSDTHVEPANASAFGPRGAPAVPANASTQNPAGAHVAPANTSTLGPVNAHVAPTTAKASTLGPVGAHLAPTNAFADALVAPANAFASDPACRSPTRTHASVCAHSLASSQTSSLEPSLSLSLVSIPGHAPALHPRYINIDESLEESHQALEVKCEESDTEISCNSFVKSRKLSSDKRQVVKTKKEVHGKRSVKIKQETIDIDEELDGDDTLVPADIRNRKRKLSNGKSQSVTIKEKKPELRKKVEKTKDICPHSSSYTQFEKILTEAAVKYSLLSIPKSFCIKNELVTTRIIFLKRKLEGKGEILLKRWPVQFFLRPTEGQFRKGWKDFTKENGLKKGDKCNFRIVSEDTLLVSTEPHKKLPTPIKEEIAEKREVSSIGTSKKKPKSFAKNEKTMAPKRNWNGKNRTEDKTETWTIVRQYHINHNYMTLPRGFCIENMLTSKRKMILKDPVGKEWFISFFLNGTKDQGRIYGVEWTTFSKENGLKEGDKCNFKLVAEDTMLVHVAKG